MKIYKFFTKIFSITLTALILTTSVFAWGPDRQTFTMAEPARYPVFNSIVDNAAVGDERDFVRIVEKGIHGTYSSDITIEAGKQYEVFIYYDNDASPTFNDAEHDYAGVARDVRLSSMFPLSLAKGERGTIAGTISASNTDPEAVWDEAYVTAKENITLHYVEGSAKIYNQGSVSGSVLSTNMFSNEGTFLGIEELNGVIPCSDEYGSGSIVYTIQTKAAGPSIGLNVIVPLSIAVIVCVGVLLSICRSRRSRR